MKDNDTSPVIVTLFLFALVSTAAFVTGILFGLGYLGFHAILYLFGR